jgi:hypothetical protein
MAPSRRSPEEENIENEAMDDHDEDHEGGRRKNKKKRVKIMTDSGQTDSDRRVLRNKQRKLQEDIASGVAGQEDGSEDDEEKKQPAFQKMRTLNNKLWNQVRYTREAVLDSENVELIAATAARQAESLVQVPRYDAVRLAQAIVKKGSVKVGSNTQFGWKNFGFNVGICFNALPSHVNFLYGPLDAEYKVKERKKVERKQKQAEPEGEEEEQQPEDVDQTQKKESDENALSAVEQHMKVIAKTLKKRAKEEDAKAGEMEDEYVAKISENIDGDGDEKERIIRKKVKAYRNEAQKVNAVQNLFNPQSFTQTVENVFHFSFLIKENKASIEVRDAETAEEFGVEPGPVIRPLHFNPDAEQGPSRQAIVSLNMRVSLPFKACIRLLSTYTID